MLCTWALFAIHVLWMVVRYALGFPIWGDEAFVVNELARSSYADLFAPLGNGQVAPLLWLWLEKACYDLGDGSILLLRLPALIAGLISTVLMLRFCLRALPQPSALLGFAVFAASYYPLRHAVEVKPYATDLLLVLVQLNLALDLFVRRGSPSVKTEDLVGRVRTKAIALALVSAIGAWGSYPSMFVSAGLAVCFLARAETRRPALLASGLVGISSLAMVFLFALPHAEAASWLMEMEMWKPTFPPWTRPWELPGWLLERHCGYMSAYPTGGRDFGSSLSFLLMVVGGVGLWRSRQRAFLGLLLAPLVFNFLAACGHFYPYGGSVRVSIFMAPAFCLLMGHGLAVCLQRLPAAPGRAGVLACCGLLFGFACFGVIRDLGQPYKAEGDVRALEFADWMVEHSLPGETIVGWCNQKDGAPDFHGLGGSMARLRVQLRQAGLEVPWLDSAGQESLPMDMRNKPVFWALAYTDDNDTEMPFPAAGWERLLERLEEYELLPDPYPHPFHKAEGIVAYRFERLPAY
jgi:hypothetical protein